MQISILLEAHFEHGCKIPGKTNQWKYGVVRVEVLIILRPVNVLLCFIDLIFASQKRAVNLVAHCVYDTRRAVNLVAHCVYDTRNWLHSVYTVSYTHLRAHET